MKIALSQLNMHVGNIEENTTKIVFCIKKAQQFNADLIVFPEMAICGYPPLDLLTYREFTSECHQAIENIARICTDIGAVIGSPSFNPEKEGKNLYNSAYFLADGKIRSIHHKTLLPNYDVFDEFRYFEPNRNFDIVEYKGKRIALTICEDLWFEQVFHNDFFNKKLYSIDPVQKLMALQPDFLINISASPFAYTKVQEKKDVFARTAEKYNLPVFMVNQVGANTDLIFEGGSLVVNAKGELFDQSARFEEDFQIYGLNEVMETPAHGTNTAATPAIKLIFQALVLGIRDFFIKTGFTRALIGLSGGLDSAVTTVLAAEALGHENVHCAFIPSEFTSELSGADAKKLAGNLNVSLDEIPIDNLINSFSQTLKPVFDDLPENSTEENIQARIRGTILMSLANKFGLILLNTSNKSELATGYSTLYGDTAGALSVLGDLYKSQVYELAHYINRNRIIIPESTITRPPSAELKKDQKDTDSLPEYEILDKILFRYIEHQNDIAGIVDEGFEVELVKEVVNMVNSSEYKRQQFPPILRVSSKSFGYGRRIPLVARL